MSTNQLASFTNDETNRETLVVPPAHLAATLVGKKWDCHELIATSRVQITSATLTVERSTDSQMVGNVVSIERVPFTLGRQDCDLTFADAQGVSRKHAQITLQNGVFCITDLASMNHTFIDDWILPVNVPTPLQDGVTIRLGSFSALRLTLQEREAT